jgi:hypothetical protein
MNRPIPAGDYVEHFNPDLPQHRAWLLALLEQLVSHQPQALGEGGTLRRLWTALRLPPERRRLRWPRSPPPSPWPSPW